MDKTLTCKFVTVRVPPGSPVGINGIPMRLMTKQVRKSFIRTEARNNKVKNVAIVTVVQRENIKIFRVQKNVVIIAEMF